MYRKIYPNDDALDLAKFRDPSKFMELLKDMDFKQRKSYLTALVVLTGNETYQKEMMKDGAKFNESKKLQTKSAKEVENWVSQDELKTLYAKYEHEAKTLYKLKSLKVDQIQHIQNFIILSLMSGLFIPIRRLQDWTEMLFKGGDSDTDNVLVGKKLQWKFVFNKYKTARFLGEQESVITPDLKSILSKWILLIKGLYPDNTHLLIDSQGKPLNPSKLNQRLNKIFGKNASVNILRHSFLTEKYKDLPALKSLENEATAMGHSLEEHLSYIRK